MFAYCGNNPVRNIDPTGEDWWEWGVAALLVAGLVVASVVTCGGAAAAAFTAMAVVTGTCGASTAATVVTAAAVGAAAAFTVSTIDAAAGSNSLEEVAERGGGVLASTVLGAAAGAAYGFTICFAAGTLVETESGTIPIEQIEPGDYVWAWDEETGDVALKQVVETYINETDVLTHVHVCGEEIVCTPGHPFYSPVKGWTEACKLRAGDILVLVNGEYVVVEKVQHELLESPIKVYNFQVEDYHTYYVAFGVLVHNSCDNRPVSPDKVSDSYIDSNNIDAHRFKNKAAGIPRSQISRYDIFRDKANGGRLWVGNKAQTIWKPTNYYFKDLIDSWTK